MVKSRALSLIKISKGLRSCGIHLGCAIDSRSRYVKLTREPLIEALALGSEIELREENSILGEI